MLISIKIGEIFLEKLYNGSVAFTKIYFRPCRGDVQYGHVGQEYVKYGLGLFFLRFIMYNIPIQIFSGKLLLHIARGRKKENGGDGN